jgi:hypothetical protein
VTRPAGPLSIVPSRARLPIRRASLCLAAFLFSSSAAAQTNDRERARAHFEVGRKQVKAGRCDLAIEEFKASIDFEPASIGARLNLGDCYVAMNRLVDAFRQFKEAESIAAKTNDPRLDDARRATAEAEAKLVRVVLREPDPPPATMTSTVDGASIGPRPWLIVVTPGEAHRIEVSTPDGRHWSVVARGKPGELVRLEISLGPALADASAPAVTTPTNGSSLRTIGLAFGGVGVLGLVSGAVFGGLTIAWRNELAHAVADERSCQGNYPTASCDASARSRLQPIEDRAFLASTVSTVSFIAGAVLVATGAMLYFTAPSTRRSHAIGVRASELLLEGRF